MKYQINKPEMDGKLNYSYSGFEWFRIERWVIGNDLVKNLFHAVKIGPFRFMFSTIRNHA